MVEHSLGKSQFYGQFALSLDGKGASPAWVLDSIDGWVLERCPSLRACALVDRDAVRIGWILGYPIRQGGMMPSGQFAIPTSVALPDFANVLWSTIEGLSGRFVAIVVAGKIQRVYLDPAGQLSAVYDPSQRLVGSSLHLVVADSTPDNEVISALNIPDQDNFYPFGLTPDKRVRRILPNHFLDLTDFAQKRHWPAKDGFSCGTARDIEGTVEAIAAKLRANVHAVAGQYPLLMSLTAGRDSRMLLAASRDVVDGVEFFTTRIPSETGRRDCRVAGSIASRLRLRHRILEWREASERDRDEYLMRTGHCVAGVALRSVRTLRQLNTLRAFLPGLCGEVGRGFYWRRKDPPCDTFSAEDVVRRLGLPLAKRLVDEAASWLSGVPTSTWLDVMDFAYIEQRLGCWAGPGHYGRIQSVVTVPLSDRRIFALMLSLPHEYRLRQKLPTDVIASLQPELLRWPFNRDIGMRGVMGQMKRLYRGFAVRCPILPSGRRHR